MSAPVKFLKGQGLLQGRTLDYGCGKGFDADVLQCSKYDPHFSPELPKGKFDTIICNYVLNVIESEVVRLHTLEQIRLLLKPQGKAYITVRRDIKQDTKTQFVIDIPWLTVVKQVSGSYCIYEMSP